MTDLHNSSLVRVERSPMTAPTLGSALGGFSLGQGFSWPDPDIDGTLIVSQPSADPELWAEYAAGAVRSYRKRGVNAPSTSTHCATATTPSCFAPSSMTPDRWLVACGPRRFAPPTTRMRSLSGRVSPVSRTSGR